MESGQPTFGAPRLHRPPAGPTRRTPLLRLGHVRHSPRRACSDTAAHQSCIWPVVVSRKTTEEPRVISPPASGPVARTRRRVASGSILGAIGLILTVTVVPATAVTRTPYNVNLVKNPSFEAGAASDGYYHVAVPYW